MAITFAPKGASIGHEEEEIEVVPLTAPIQEPTIAPSEAPVEPSPVKEPVPA